MIVSKSLRTAQLMNYTYRNFRAAVVLHGCGVYDGSEITESVSMLVSLSRYGADVQIYAPNRPQGEVVDHSKGEPAQGEKRNVLAESARIARGNLKDLAELDASKFDALFIPGGFGAAKNLSDFGSKGADMAVQPDIEKVIKAFHTQKKHIGVCCIAPVLLGKVLGSKSGGPGLQMTLGGKGDSWPFSGSIDATKSWGNTIEEKDVDQVTIDENNLVFTTPAYMKGDAKPHEVFEGVEKLVGTIAKRLKK